MYNLGAQREATHFKIRILDLLDIFINKQPQSVHVPRIILPLVKIIISCGPDERQLSEKTTGILRARIGKLKDIPSDGFDKASVLEDLQSLHELARKMAVPEVSACSIYLSRVLQGGEEVLDVYRASVDDFVQRKNSKVAPAFLKDFIVRQAAHAWGLREDIIEKCRPGVAVNVYRQMQLWGLVQAMLSQVPPLVSHFLRAREAAAYLCFVGAATGCRGGVLRICASRPGRAVCNSAPRLSTNRKCGERCTSEGIVQDRAAGRTFNSEDRQAHGWHRCLLGRCGFRVGPAGACAVR